MNKIKIHLLTAATAVLFSASSLHGVLFSEPFDYPETGNINTGTNASDNGWWAVNPDNVRMPATALNSPWTAADSTSSVRIYRDGSNNGALYNSFIDTDDVTGSIGHSFNAGNQPANLGFVWDWRTTTVDGTNPGRMEIRIGGATGAAVGTTAIRMFVTSDFDSFSIRNGADTADTITTGAGTFSQNTWYRFSVENVSMSDQTFDIRIFSEADLVTPFFTQTGINFQNTVTDLESARFMYLTASTNNRWYNVDNFTIIPEPSTYALIFGVLALAGALLRRRLRR